MLSHYFQYLYPKGDRLIQCRQFVIRFEELPIDDFYLELYRDGYLWDFPIQNGIVHFSAGTFDGSHKTKLLTFIEQYDDYKVLKTGNKAIRLLPPSKCTPFIHNNIIGVSEAIGVVRPLIGEGISTSLKSVEILVECLLSEDFSSYEPKILKAFEGNEIEYNYIQSRVKGQRLRGLWYGARLKQPLIDDLPLNQKIKIFRAMS